MDPEKLSGIRLADGWTLDHPRDVSTTGSGACHSLGYIASNDKGNVGFVKVLDTRINRDLRIRSPTSNSGSMYSSTNARFSNDASTEE